VYKGIGTNKKNSVIDAQAASLINQAVDIIAFPLKTKGFISYITEYFRLLKYICFKEIDLIHAHYSYSGIISALTFKKTICSLMGSDVFSQPKIVLRITNLFYKYLWKVTIVKSPQMKIDFPKARLIPNGVNFNIFKPEEQRMSVEKTILKRNCFNIIFVAEDINADVKNFKLAQASVKNINRDDITLNPISGLTQNELVNYYNAADLLLITSTSEGSPNVIKEAMACNCPIVSADVGDVRDLIGDIEGCYTTTYEPEDVAEKIRMAIDFGKRTNGRHNIFHLDSDRVANRIVNIYQRILF